MLSSDSEIACIHSANNETDVAPSTEDNEKETSEIKAKGKATAITRRMSFSATRSWSSYAENYSSCLSSLRRNSSSSALLSPRKDSLQSSSFASLSRSLDSQQLKNLKTETSISEEKQRPLKVSPLHARPFHQRRWSSPVTFPIANSATVASSSPQTSQNLKNEAASNYVSANISDKIQNDKISETEEITLQSYFHDEPSVLQAPTNITTTEGEERDNKQESTSLDDSKEMMESPIDAKGFVEESQTGYSVRKEAVREDANENIIAKNHENIMDNIGDKNHEVTTFKINSPTKVETTTSAKIEEIFQKINIYTEIKKSTKWSSSKKFRRRYHTIHTDTRHFLMNRHLSTIIEQSSISLDARSNSSKETNGAGELQNRRSRSLEDVKTLSEEAENKGVFVQQLSKSLCVPIGAGNTRSNKKNSTDVTAVKYHDEKSGRNGPVQVNQVNVQTFSFAERSNDVRPQYMRAVICGEQSKTFAETKNSTRPQHAVFTQTKPKWASITISQI